MFFEDTCSNLKTHVKIHLIQNPLKTAEEKCDFLKVQKCNEKLNLPTSSFV